MATSEKDKIGILKISIRELENNYNRISNIYDQLRIKALALIAGEVAIVTFLFTHWDFRKVLEGSDRIIFFFTGVVLLSLAFGILLWVISTVEWKIPHDTRRADTLLNDKNYDSELAFLKYLNDDYAKVNEFCNSLVSRKCKRFNWTVFLLAIGVIIVMVIKFGGPQQ